MLESRRMLEMEDSKKFQINAISMKDEAYMSFSYKIAYILQTYSQQ